MSLNLRQALDRRQFLLASSTALAAGCGVGLRQQRNAPLRHQPNLLVWLADSLRPDRLPCYGHPLDTAPNISSFARDAIVFERCYSAATWTLPATLSLLTGVPPLVHRTVVPEWSEIGRARGKMHQVLPETIPTTAALLLAEGYDTAHFQANPNATREHGIEGGFNHYYYQLNAGYKEHTEAFLEWLRTTAREPFYAYVHLIDPHEPYTPEPHVFQSLHGQSIEEKRAHLPAPEAAALADYHRQTWNDLFNANHRPGPEVLSTFSPDGLAYLQALYCAEIRGMDEQFGRAIQALKDRGVFDRTAIVFTSDHGEAFGENGLFYHGSGLHDPQVHIPLLIKHPGMSGEHRVQETVSQYDLHPTLLALAGAPQGDAYGNVLVDRAGNLLPDGTRPVLTSLDLNNPDPKSWRFRMTAGDIQVESGHDLAQCTVRKTAGPPNLRTLSVQDVPALKDPAIRDVVEYFYTERYYLEQLSRAHPTPAWTIASKSNDAALEALGYL